MPRGILVMFVVKGNAYGHGAAVCAAAASHRGLADWLGVSSVEEGVSLREAGLRLPILVLGSLYPFESFLAAVEYGLTPTVASLESAKRLSDVSRRLRQRVACHLKIETGMGRIGVTPEAAMKVVKFLSGEKLVRLTGVYTHLSCAEDSSAFTRSQLSCFKKAVGAIEGLLGRNLLRHAANSAAALKYPESRWDMTRPGIALYGLCPGFSPILSLKSKVVFLKSVPKGAPISYGASYRTSRPSRIATVPVGYADGVSRGLSNRGFALLGGRRCAIVGRVTMDMLMLDATESPQTRVGDDCVLIGAQGSARITAQEIAQTLGTIPYEVTTSLSSRVPRVYLS
jgi:alanine racemase